jgi:mono/diheme cytochrome c family protein
MKRLVLIVGFGWAVAACGGGAGSGTEPETPSAPAEAAPAAPAAQSEEAASATATPATFDDQVALGGQLYAANCAGCHGDQGQGGKAPRVVGLKEGALPLDPPAGAKFRKVQFKTVGDVAKWVSAHMPPEKGGSLTEEQYFAILAFDLKANGINLPAKLDMPTAESLEIPR